jgi:hypothetical protein
VSAPVSLGAAGRPTRYPRRPHLEQSLRWAQAGPVAVVAGAAEGDRGYMPPADRFLNYSLERH